jgi:hypothetical protein
LKYYFKEKPSIISKKQEFGGVLDGTKQRAVDRFGKIFLILD